MSARYLSILRAVVDLPTAPFQESAVIRYIRRFTAARPELSLNTDRFGNLLVRYRPPRRAIHVRRPILFAAHMDHPGFVASRMIDSRRCQADFRGWVQASYCSGERIRFFSGGQWIRGKIEKVLHKKEKRASRALASARSFRDQEPPQGVIARCAVPVAPGSPGMWDFPDAQLRANKLHARACDDLAGLAAVLCAIDQLCQQKSRVPFM